MEVETTHPSLRFIKRVPPSGGAPAYKLTLSHKIVKERLQHLIDQPFQLAISPSSPQTWEASIAPRRNKDRCEYILQGWKLFAEAHSLQAGDQIAFELVEPRRLIVKCIKPAASERPLPLVRDISDISDGSEVLELQAAKTPRTADCSSPSRASMRWQPEAQPLTESRRSLQSRPSSRGPSSRRSLSLPAEPAPMAHKVHSWLSLNLPSPRAGSAVSSASKLFTPESTIATPGPTLEAPLPNDHEVALLSHLETELPGIFDDMCQGLDSVVPDGPQANHSVSGRMSTPESLRSTDLTQYHLQHMPHVSELQSHENELRALVSSIQDRLDQSTRSALQATMGLESCVVEMTSPANQSAAREVQARMFRFLSALKESLWQVLLVSNDAYGSER